MKLPKEISPCPILEALVEVRYSANPKMPIDAIFGLAYQKLQQDFPSVVNLPILQVPEQIRVNDPNLRYQPHHKLSNDDFTLSIGPKVLTFACQAPYSGWDPFFDMIGRVLGVLGEIDGMIDKVERLGVRFVNGFEGDLSENVALTISTPKLELEDCKYHSTFVLPDEEFGNTIQVANKAQLKIGHQEKSGSVVDIDTYRDDVSGDLKRDLLGFIDRAHECEKKIFFSLLKEDVLDKLNPVYLS